MPDEKLRSLEGTTVTKRPDVEETLAIIGSDEPVQFSGFLQKQTSSGSTRSFRPARVWRTRWYELRGTCLIYYRHQPHTVSSSSSSSTTGHSPLGVLHLHEIRSVSLEAADDHAVLVLKSASNSYRFRALDASSVSQQGALSKWNDMLLARVADIQCPDFVSTLRALYMAYNPQLMAAVPALALSFRSRQALLVRTIHKKYDHDGNGEAVDYDTRSSILEIESIERGDVEQEGAKRSRRSTEMEAGTRGRKESVLRTYLVGDSILARYRYRGDFRAAKVVGIDRADDMLYDVKFFGDGTLQPKTLVNHMRPAVASNDGTAEAIEDADEDADEIAEEDEEAGGGDVEMQPYDVQNPVHQRRGDESEGRGSDSSGWAAESQVHQSFNDSHLQSIFSEAEESSGDEEEMHLDSAVEGLGEGFYTLAIAKLFSSRTKIWLKVGWVGLMILLFASQVMVAMSLILDAVVPQCLQQSDCGYLGYVCLTFHHQTAVTLSSPVCLECRAVLDNYHLTCKEQYGAFYVTDDNENNIDKKIKRAKNGQWSENFHGKAVVAGKQGGKNQTLAADFCLSDDVDYARGNTCHAYSTQLEMLHLNGYMVLIFVALVVGLSVMGEKRQSLFMSTLLISKYGSAFGLQTGEDIGPLKCIKELFCPCLHKGVKTRQLGSKLERKLVVVAWTINVLRIRILLPMVVTTVVALVGFQGSSSLDIALNGLATVFILEIDDVIGVTLFSGRFRERARNQLRKEFSKVQSLPLEVHIDQMSCQFSIIATMFSVLICLGKDWQYASCVRVMYLWVYVNYITLNGMLVVEQTAKAAAPELTAWVSIDWQESGMSLRKKLRIFFLSGRQRMISHFWKGCLYTFISTLMAQQLLLVWAILRGGTAMAVIMGGFLDDKTFYKHIWGGLGSSFNFWKEDKPGCTDY